MSATSTRMTKTPSSGLAGAFWRAAVPLAAYFTVTLILPLANGAARAGAPFVEHAIVVLLVPPVVIALVWSAGTLARALMRGMRARRTLHHLRRQ